MNPIERQQQINREALRYRILETAYHAGDLGLKRSMVLSIVNSIFPSTEAQVLEAVRYLAAKKLIDFENTAEWKVTRTVEGIDYYENPEDEVDGISRPLY